MDRTPKAILLTVAAVIFIGSFFLKHFYPATTDLTDGLIKGFAICILIFVIIKGRITKRPFDPF